MITNNIILMTDSYKLSHFLQYPEGTTSMFSYIESRGGMFDKTVFFGLQVFTDFLEANPVTQAMIDEAEAVSTLHGVPFNRAGWEHILRVHGGKLPVKIRAVAEGTVVPTRNILVSIESTDPEVFWIASYLETALLRAVWYPTTVATLSYHCREIIKRYLEKTCENPAAEIDFKLHDFGARGVSSQESAAIGGAAHLVNFMGTDTIEALLLAKKVYKAEMAGFSIPAAEHSTMTALGPDGELAQFERMVDAYGQGLFATVSDGYNIWEAISTKWASLKDKIIAKGGRLVIRPDSGHPPTVVLKCLELMEEAFGVTINAKGYKVLHPSFRLIQGDGINIESLEEILRVITDAGYSAENVAFGMGGGLLQQVNRDTLKFAMKCTEMTIDGIKRPIYKDPVTDPGKRSKKGFLDLVKKDGEYITVGHDAGTLSQMVTVFENGEVLKRYTFDEIRHKAREPFIAARPVGV